jgi:hypothetical protein
MISRSVPLAYEDCQHVRFSSRTDVIVSTVTFLANSSASAFAKIFIKHLKVNASARHCRSLSFAYQFCPFRGQRTRLQANQQMSSGCIELVVIHFSCERIRCYARNYETKSPGKHRRSCDRKQHADWRRSREKRQVEEVSRCGRHACDSREVLWLYEPEVDEHQRGVRCTDLGLHMITEAAASDVDATHN